MDIILILMDNNEYCSVKIRTPVIKIDNGGIIILIFYHVKDYLFLYAVLII